jgi:Abnormal spindle-like microcephaly-assoc'd, ASPM-SPD-2-Hydin/Cep192 domain 4
VTQVAADPKDPLTAYATFSGFSGFTDSLGHVFESPDGSTGWTDISGNLPNVPVNDIVVDPDVPNTLYVATDIGVFEGVNPGTGWQWSAMDVCSAVNTTSGCLPNVAVLSLKLNEASRILRVGTHGRSAWDLFVPANLPVADFSTAEVNFGNQLINSTSAAQTVTLTNNGTSSMAISGISISGTNSVDFVETNTCPATLAAGSNCTITLTFSTSSRGTFTADLQVADNAPASPQLVYLSGTGINPVASVSPSSLTFGNQNVGSTSTAQTITLTDTGQDALTVSGVNIAGADAGDFKETDNCVGTVAANASCTISVTFAPSAPLGRTATLSITDNAAGSPQNVGLTGTAVGPAVSLSPSSLNFSGQLVGSASSNQTVTLTNSGNANLTINSAGISGPNAGDFLIAASGTTCSAGTSIAAGANCGIAVNFVPSGSGGRVATINISDNASSSPQNVPLAGTGEDFSVAVASGTSSTATVTPGESATYTISLNPLGGFSQMVTLTCMGAPSLATCSASPSSVTLNGTTAGTATITVTTTAATILPPKTPPEPRGWDYPPALGVLLLWLMLIATLRWRTTQKLVARFSRWRHFCLPEKGKGKARVSRAVLALGLIMIFIAAWASCGGGGGGGGVTHNPGTPAGTYTLTVTGTGPSSSSTITHSVTLTLTVQ